MSEHPTLIPPEWRDQIPRSRVIKGRLCGVQRFILTAGLLVAAVAVFGNPATKFGNPVTAAVPPFAGKGIDLCADGDPICSQGRNPFAHTSYEKTDMVSQAAGFVAAML